ncbi:uncharacterized protein LOC106753808 isoform X3 [Vigna radiata var. radiata]|uniref:Uncharacterized protein LOC106753808 isoform X3 n=1 Tax=Vigna radiata var. radiata TaxID=3916 RepID=A0A3Q0ER08_VIGRR|nr:uncharacterized protein LOC106753808 isoform X3 [Vigna radiata var. radiata]
MVVLRKQICNGREKRDRIGGDGTVNNSGRLAPFSFFAAEKNQGFGENWFSHFGFGNGDGKMKRMKVKIEGSYIKCYYPDSQGDLRLAREFWLTEDNGKQAHTTIYTNQISFVHLSAHIKKAQSWACRWAWLKSLGAGKLCRKLMILLLFGREVLFFPQVVMIGDGETLR